MPNNFTTSDEGLQLVRKSEGTKYHLYNDPVNHCTIGTGHLVHLGPICGAASELPFIHGITPEQETALLRKDLAFAEHAVNTLVTVPLNQHQFDGLVDWTFNLGSGALQKSTFFKLLNQGHYDQVTAGMALYDRAGGRVFPALDIRRANEIHIFEEAA